MNSTHSTPSSSCLAFQHAEGAIHNLSLSTDNNREEAALFYSLKLIHINSLNTIKNIDEILIIQTDKHYSVESQASR